MTRHPGTGTAASFSLPANANNHISTAPFAYDAAGNETADAAGTYTWNAEGELKAAGGVTYTYDGDGKRVQKSNGKLYWYGADGNVLEETDATGSMTNGAFNEYVYFAGKRIARRDAAGDVFYYSQDMVGSSVAMVEVPAGGTTATVCYDADFYPHGGEKVVTSTCSQNYKWTGKERDAETGNDDFDARYYSSTYGRFLSADWSAVPVAVPYANLTNPQTLNLYAIVRDNPESFADLDGHEAATGTQGACGDATSGCGGSNQNTTGQDQKTQQQNQATAGVSATANGNSVTLTRVSWNEDPSTGGTETIETRTGEHPFRDNNPGDIRAGNFSNSSGAVGEDKGFAIFPTTGSGFDALGKLLGGSHYKDLSLDQAVAKFAPPVENNTAAYQASVRTEVGSAGGTRLSSLSAGQMQKLGVAIARTEGFYHGGTVTTESVHIFPAP